MGGLIAIRHFFLDFRHGEMAKIDGENGDFFTIFAMAKIEKKMANGNEPPIFKTIHWTLVVCRSSAYINTVAMGSGVLLVLVRWS